MYVCSLCVSNDSSQTTEPICIKVTSANRASDADCYRLRRFEIFTSTIFKTPKTSPKWAWIGIFKLNQHNIETHISRPRFERFRWNLAYWWHTFLTVPTVKNLKFLKSKMVTAAILKNRKITISLPRLERFRQNLAWLGYAVRPSWPFCPSKISNFENPRWRRPPSWKIEKSRYLGCGSSDFYEILHIDALLTTCLGIDIALEGGFD